MLLALGVALVVGNILLREFSTVEVKTSDLVFLVIPLVLVALATGKLKGVDLFGVKADLSDVWSAAAQTRIAKQVASATVQNAVHVMEMGTKGGMKDLVPLLERKIEALAFRLSQGNYKADVINNYFQPFSVAPTSV